MPTRYTAAAVYFKAGQPVSYSLYAGEPSPPPAQLPGLVLRMVGFDEVYRLFPEIIPLHYHPDGTPREDSSDGELPDWLKPTADVLVVDPEALWDVVGVPYDCAANDRELVIELRHVDAIVSAHGPTGVYLANVVARLRGNPHVVGISRTRNVLSVTLDRPVELGGDAP